jgi:hypothetical protein
MVVHNPDRGLLRAEIADVELTFSTRSCFSEKTVNRAVLVGRGEATGMLAWAKVWRLAEGHT